MTLGEVVRQSNRSDVVSKENAATHTETVFARWRKDVPLEVSYQYWRDVHGIMVARIPGIYQYRLLQLAFNRGDLWSAIDGIDYTLPEVEQPHGVTEMLFLTKEDQQTFGNSSINTQYVFKDEQNLCDLNVTMSAIGNNAHTFVDRMEPIPNGELRFPSFMLCFQQQ